MKVKRFFYKYYKKWFLFDRWFRRRFTSQGRFFLMIFFVSVIFGISTRRSMVFVLLGVAVSVLVISFFTTRRKKPDIAIKRFLPDQTEVNSPLSYQVRVKNKGDRELRGLYLKELPVDPRPSLNVFLNTVEDGEEKRNIYDRTMGFYRWMWILKRNVGAVFEKKALPVILPGEEITVKMELSSIRRGHVEFSGMEVFIPGPFNLLCSFHVFPVQSSVLSLPEIFSVDVETDKARSGESENAIWRSTGLQGEFMFVREYRPGDDIRFMNIRLLAKTDEPMINQYMPETGAPFDIICDCYPPDSGTEYFESAVSLAASVEKAFISAFSSAGLFIYEDSVEDFRMKGEPEILEKFALMKQPEKGDFSMTLNTVIENMDSLAAVVLILTSWDKTRKYLVDELLNAGREVKLIFLTDGDKKNLENDIPTEFSAVYNYKNVRYEIERI
ncbi:MAG: DUF58 domain-containing protein [bacterium]